MVWESDLWMHDTYQPCKDVSYYPHSSIHLCRALCSSLKCQWYHSVLLDLRLLLELLRERVVRVSIPALRLVESIAIVWRKLNAVLDAVH